MGHADQLSLLDVPADPTYRSDGPETSKVAGKTVQTNAREEECIEALRRLVCAADCHDIRAVLLEYGLDRPTNTISRRLTSLERRGLVRRAGVKTGPAGKPCTIWRLAS